MRCSVIASACIAIMVASSEASRLRAQAQGQAHAGAVAARTSLGESKAAWVFFQEWLGALPKNISNSKQEAVVTTLESEVAKLTENVNAIKKLEAKDKMHGNTT